MIKIVFWNRIKEQISKVTVFRMNIASSDVMAVLYGSRMTPI